MTSAANVHYEGHPYVRDLIGRLCVHQGCELCLLVINQSEQDNLATAIPFILIGI